MRGRPPKPTALKVLHGNPGKRKLNDREPKPTPKAPGMPTTLSREAKAEWRRVSQELDRIGMLTKVDRGALATYCMAWARMVEADRHIQEHGTVLIEYVSETIDGQTIIARPAVNPSTRVFKDNAAIVRAFASEFGLTPSARTRVKVPEPDDQGLEELLGPGRSRGAPSA